MKDLRKAILKIRFILQANGHSVHQAHDSREQVGSQMDHDRKDHISPIQLRCGAEDQTHGESIEKLNHIPVPDGEGGC